MGTVMWGCAVKRASIKDAFVGGEHKSQPNEATFDLSRYG
jgi:hypothetical protein